MFNVTSAIFNEIEEITPTELIELYENGELQELAYFFTNVLSDDHVYLDMNVDELLQDWLNGDHRLMRIKRNSLLSEAIGFIYGTYDTIEIVKKNKKIAVLNDDLFFFTGYNYDYINELFSDIGGRQGFLDKINIDR